MTINKFINMHFDAYPALKTLILWYSISKQTSESRGIWTFYFSEYNGLANLFDFNFHPGYGFWCGVFRRERITKGVFSFEDLREYEKDALVYLESINKKTGISKWVVFKSLLLKRIL